MKFNRDRNWLAKRAEQEDQHFISVGGLISRIDPEWQADVSSMPNVETTKTAFVRLLQLARRERRLVLGATRARKPMLIWQNWSRLRRTNPSSQLLEPFTNWRHFSSFPAKKLMVLAGLLQVKDFGLQQASVRFAARSEPVEDVSPEEHAAFEEYVKFLNEQ